MPVISLDAVMVLSRVERGPLFVGMQSKTDIVPSSASARAEGHRQRFRQFQADAAKAQRSQPLTEVETARLVADFHARGGLVTICPPMEAGTVTAGD